NKQMVPFQTPNQQTIGQQNVVAGNTIPVGTVGFATVGRDGVTGTPTEFIQNPVGPAGRGTGVNLPNTSPNSSAFTFGFINNTEMLTATLNALATEGKTKVLSSPRIITLNNKEAKIQVGSKLPFSTVTISQAGVATQSITFVDVGILLDV